MKAHWIINPPDDEPDQMAQDIAALEEDLEKMSDNR